MWSVSHFVMPPSRSCSPCLSRFAAEAASALHSTALHTAVASGFVFDVARALRNDPDALTQRASNGHTPLELACGLGKAYIVRHLIDAGADPCLYGRENNQHPIYRSISAKAHNSLLVLLAAGVDPETKFHNGTYPLHLASSCGDTQCMDTLLRAGADPFKIATVRDWSERTHFITPLYSSVVARQVQATELLLSIPGATVDRLVADTVCSMRHLETFQVVAEKIAIDCRAGDLSRETSRVFARVLHGAVEAGFGTIVVKMVEAGVPYDHYSVIGQCYTLGAACSARLPRAFNCIVGAYLKHGAGGLDEFNIFCNTPLLTACQVPNKQAIRTLVANGANPFHGAVFQPLIYAIRKGALSIVDTLLDCDGVVPRLYDLSVARRVGNRSILTSVCKALLCKRPELFDLWLEMESRRADKNLQPRPSELRKKFRRRGCESKLAFPVYFKHASFLEARFCGFLETLNRCSDVQGEDLVDPIAKCCLYQLRANADLSPGTRAAMLLCVHTHVRGGGLTRRTKYYATRALVVACAWQVSRDDDDTDLQKEAAVLRQQLSLAWVYFGGEMQDTSWSMGAYCACVFPAVLLIVGGDAQFSRAVRKSALKRAREELCGLLHFKF